MHVDAGNGRSAASLIAAVLAASAIAVVHGAGEDALHFFLRAAASTTAMTAMTSGAASAVAMTTATTTAAAAAGTGMTATTSRTSAGPTPATTAPPAFTASGTSGGVVRSNVHALTRLVVLIFKKSHVWIQLRSELGVALTV